MPHPVYSADVAPSDFDLFCTMKEKLTGVEHDLEESIKSHIFEILDEFEPDYFYNSKNMYMK